MKGKCLVAFLVIILAFIGGIALCLIFYPLRLNFMTPFNIYVKIETVYMMPYKEKSIEMMELKKGDKVVDIGSGMSWTQIILAPHVGDKGELVGIEADPTLFRKSNTMLKELGLDKLVHNVHQRVEPGNPINYPDNYFDVSFSARVLCTSKIYDFLINEMIRVTKVGGKIHVTCADFSTLSSTSLSTFQEFILKKTMETFMGEQYTFAKNSKKILKEKRLENVSQAIVPTINDEGYHRIDIQNAYLQIKNQIKPPYTLIYNIIDWLIITPFVEKISEQTEKGNYYDMRNIVIVQGVKTSKTEEFIRSTKKNANPNKKEL